jgi:hypothetical protein
LPEPGFKVPFPHFTPVNVKKRPTVQPTELGAPLALQVPSRRWQSPASAPAGVCRIAAAHLHGLSVQGGNVVMRIKPYPGLIGHAFLSCIDTVYHLNSWSLDAGVLLNASNPGTPPASLPGMRPVFEHAGIFAAPSAGGEMLARLVRGGWLVVSGGSGLRQRLTLLKHLDATVHL